VECGALGGDVADVTCVDSNQHVAFTSFWRMVTMVARVPPLREPFEAQGKPTRSRGANAKKRRRLTSVGMTVWVVVIEKPPAGVPFEAQGKPALPEEAVGAD
jgi:hypothetical protein